MYLMGTRDANDFISRRKPLSLSDWDSIEEILWIEGLSKNEQKLNRVGKTRGRLETSFQCKMVEYYSPHAQKQGSYQTCTYLDRTDADPIMSPKWPFMTKVLIHSTSAMKRDAKKLSWRYWYVVFSILCLQHKDLGVCCSASTKFCLTNIGIFRVF